MNYFREVILSIKPYVRDPNILQTTDEVRMRQNNSKGKFNQFRNGELEKIKNRFCIGLCDLKR